MMFKINARFDRLDAKLDALAVQIGGLAERVAHLEGCARSAFNVISVGAAIVSLAGAFTAWTHH